MQNLCGSALKHELVTITPSLSTDLHSDLLDSCLDCSDDKYVFLINRLVSSGRGKRCGLQKYDPFSDSASPGEGTMLQTQDHVILPSACLGPHNLVCPVLFLLRAKCLEVTPGLGCYLWHRRGSSPWCDKDWALRTTDKWVVFFFLRNNLWFSFLIWSEPVLLKASFGNVGAGWLHVILLAWKKHLTRCLVRA